MSTVPLESTHRFFSLFSQRWRRPQSILILSLLKPTKHGYIVHFINRVSPSQPMCKKIITELLYARTSKYKNGDDDRETQRAPFLDWGDEYWKEWVVEEDGDYSKGIFLSFVVANVWLHPLFSLLWMSLVLAVLWMCKQRMKPSYFFYQRKFFLHKKSDVTLS